MSRAEVRTQLATFLTTPPIAELNQVFTSFPKQINFQVGSTAGQVSRAAAVIFIQSERENRIALGGATSGKKRVDYECVLQIFHHSMQRDSQDAMDDFDITIDNIKDRLRSDHRFGNPNGNLIWQGAEPGMSVSYGEPSSSDRGVTETWATISFQVTQIYTA
jgi:hypothetical protein